MINADLTTRHWSEHCHYTWRTSDFQITGLAQNWSIF